MTLIRKKIAKATLVQQECFEGAWIFMANDPLSREVLDCCLSMPRDEYGLILALKRHFPK